MILLLYCLLQGYHQRTRNLRTDLHYWSSGKQFSQNHSHPLRSPIDCTDHQLWSLYHLEILVIMFPPCPAIFTPTPHNILRPFFLGDFIIQVFGSYGLLRAIQSFMDFYLPIIFRIIAATNIHVWICFHLFVHRTHIPWIYALYRSWIIFVIFTYGFVGCV